MTTNYNMQLPPPNVTGIAIPGALAVENSPLDHYQRTLETRREAQRLLNERNSQFAPTKKEGSKVLKLVLGAVAAVGLFFGGKKLYQHFKK